MRERTSLRRLALGLAALAGMLLPAAAHAHGEPVSYVTLHVGPAAIDAVVEAQAIDLAHDLPDVEADTLLRPDGLSRQAKTLASILAPRLVIRRNDVALVGTLVDAAPVPEKTSVRLAALRGRRHGRRLCRAGAIDPGALPAVSYDPRHKTYLSISDGPRLALEQILTADRPEAVCRIGADPSSLAVIRQFVQEGIHHIFIGPDHILFIVGLLLLGGALSQLLKIVTAFTVAHSLTLVLAALNLVSPPSRLVEPAIALSIVFVGIDSLFVAPGKRDRRLLFAFCFGLIHGFGFASVLREMELPWQALGWSLFSFNVGVEMGQACIVLAVAPVLALLRVRSDVVARRVVMAGSVLVTVAGAFWFVQRVVS